MALSIDEPGLRVSDGGTTGARETEGPGTSVTGAGPVVTTSWDDGHPTDLRLAELLDRLGLAGTFYVPVRNPERPVSPPREIQQLGQRFEIGAHTISHRRLVGLDASEMHAEIAGGREVLEDLLGRQVTAFCYPGGKFSRRVRTEVERAGFVVARTTMGFRHDWAVDRLLLPTSVQAFPHPVGTHVRHALKEGNWSGAGNCLIHAAVPRRDWARVAVRLLGEAVRKHGWWHLWGHSWEIEALDAWDDLASVLREAAASGARPVTNTELGSLVE